MYKGIENISLEQNRYVDNLFLPYCENEDELLKKIYDILTQRRNKNKRLVIIIDNIDEIFLSRLLSSVDAIKTLGYSSISFEARIRQDVNEESLKHSLEEYQIPLKIKYYLSSSDDTFRKRLEEDIKIRIDPDLISLNHYQELVSNNPIYSKSFKKANKNLYVGEIVYELIRDVNSSLFECALLQYYASRYNLAITLLREKDLVDLWVEQISKYSPNIIILNINNKKEKNKVLNKAIK